MDAGWLGALAQASATISLAMDVVFAVAATTLWWTRRRRVLQLATAPEVAPVRRPTGR